MSPFRKQYENERTQTSTSTIELTKLEEFQRIEAEWVTRELEECVKLIQRYRSLYLTAVFLTVGWVLSQIINATSASSSSGNPITSLTFDSLRQRPDIAAVLCLVPFINVLFGLLMLEATAQMQSLARYRFLLGFELGGDLPVWRWECWKSSKHGSVRAWTNPLNILFTIVIVLLTIAALWFSHPAVGGSKPLVVLWWTALVMNLIAAAVIGVVSLKNRQHNFVATQPPTNWSNLWPLKSTLTTNVIRSNESLEDRAVNGEVGTRMTYQGIITIEPGKRGGQPTIRGMRITVADVLGWLAAGMTHEEILSDYPELTEEDIRACLAYAADRERRIVTAA